MKKNKYRMLFFTLLLFGLNFTGVEVSAKTITSQITLNASTKKIYTGQTIQLKASVLGKDIKWVSSNKKVAGVTAKGKVTGKKKGTVKITAFLKKNKKIKATCRVEVKDSDGMQIKYSIKEYKNVPLSVDQSKVKEHQQEIIPI